MYNLWELISFFSKEGAASQICKENWSGHWDFWNSQFSSRYKHWSKYFLGCQTRRNPFEKKGRECFHQIFFKNYAVSHKGRWYSWFMINGMCILSWSLVMSSTCARTNHPWILQSPSGQSALTPILSWTVHCPLQISYSLKCYIPPNYLSSFPPVLWNNRKNVCIYINICVKYMCFIYTYITSNTCYILDSFPGCWHRAPKFLEFPDKNTGSIFCLTICLWPWCLTQSS